MPIPPWLFSAQDVNLDISVSKSDYDNTTVYLTDARKCGVMLRDKRLTLRSHAAITDFRIEAASETEYILAALNEDGSNNYLRVGDKQAFFASASKADAAKFQLKVTALGVELYHGETRPAVFDDNNDVSVGAWRKGYSTIPILVEKDVEVIWPKTAATVGAGVTRPSIGYPM